jgi:hypothetical protein
MVNNVLADERAMIILSFGRFRRGQMGELGAVDLLSYGIYPEFTLIAIPCQA